MGDGLSVKRTSVGTVNFGYTPPIFELLQSVLCPYAGDVDETMYYQKKLVRRKTKRNIKFVYNQNTMPLQSLLGVEA